MTSHAPVGSSDSRPLSRRLATALLLGILALPFVLYPEPLVRAVALLAPAAAPTLATAILVVYYCVIGANAVLALVLAIPSESSPHDGNVAASSDGPRLLEYVLIAALIVVVAMIALIFLGGRAR